MHLSETTRQTNVAPVLVMHSIGTNLTLFHPKKRDLCRLSSVYRSHDPFPTTGSADQCLVDHITACVYKRTHIMVKLSTGATVSSTPYALLGVVGMRYDTSQLFIRLCQAEKLEMIELSTLLQR
jgi:hypothetical protein